MPSWWTSSFSNCGCSPPDPQPSGPFVDPPPRHVRRCLFGQWTTSERSQVRQIQRQRLIEDLRQLHAYCHLLEVGKGGP